MVYKTGIASNSHQLANIIHNAMLEAGWTLRSEISPDGTDSVFYSDGEDGNNDIYIRVAAKHSDKVNHGDIQFPSSDGYTGFVNFFAYQYYPEDGDAYAGLNEIGTFGPLIYQIDDEFSSNRGIKEFNMYSSDVSGVTQRTLDSGSAFANGPGEFDGRKYLWYNRDDDQLRRADISREQNSILFSIRRNDFFVVTPFRHDVAISRKSPNELLIWALKEGTNAGLVTFDIFTESVVDIGTDTAVYPQPPWGTDAGVDGFIVQGMRRNGKKYLYVSRGDNTNQWARYDIDENSWESLSSLPAQLNSGATGLLIPREASGYIYDRIYIIRADSTNQFFSVALDDNGDFIGSSFHSVVPFTVSGAGQVDMTYCGGNRIFMIRDNFDELYYFELPDTTDGSGSGSWTTINSWAEQNLAGAEFFSGHFHLCCRARVDEFVGTPYWIFVNKNRVAWVTQTLQSQVSRDEYEWGYAGAFNTFGSRDTTSLASSVSAGSQTIEVEDASLFKIGTKYRLVDISDTNTNTHIGFNGMERKIASAEFVTVTAVKQHSVSPAQIDIESPLQYDYSSNAVIGEEVQPIGVSVDNMNRFQTLNYLNVNGHISNNPPYQWYTIQNSQLEINRLSERTGGVVAWPLLLVHSGTADNIDISESDIRGVLEGVFNTASDLGPSRTTIDIGGKDYIVFDIFDPFIANFLAFGPME